MPSDIFLSEFYVEYHFAECRYAECRGAFNNTKQMWLYNIR
jgi:hypothetical protein